MESASSKPDRSRSRYSRSELERDRFGETGDNYSDAAQIREAVDRYTGRSIPTPAHDWPARLSMEDMKP